MKGIFTGSRYANVTATMALIVALGGTAYAANTIRSGDIANGQVKSADIGTGSQGYQRGWPELCCRDGKPEAAGSVAAPRPIVP